jgi:hypothetical protein
MAEMWKYVIVGDGRMAIGVHSSLNYVEFKDHIERLIVVENGVRGFRSGIDLFLNPRIMLADDFVDYLPALIEVK